MNTLKAVLFDLDGTLADTAPDFVLAGNALRESHSLPPLDAAEISMHVSSGAAAVTQRCMEISGEHPDFEALRDQLLDHYQQHLGAKSRIYPGVTDFLNGAIGKSAVWGVVTNKPYHYAEQLISMYGLDKQCAVLVCPDHVKNRKPAPDSLLLAAQKLSLGSDEIVYVGDHKRDIDAGKAAGMPTVAVGYGYLLGDDNPRRWGADHFAQTDTDLSELLESLLG